MFRRTSIAVVCLLASLAAATAQVTIHRKASAKPGQEIRIGVFANLRADCTAGPLPTISLSKAPSNGNVRVSLTKVRLTNHKNCLAIEVPGYVATYKSKDGFAGEDRVELDLKSADGKMLRRHGVTINVGQDAAGASI